MSRTAGPDSRPGEHLAELFRDHADGLTGAIRAILGPQADAQELLQDAFVKAFGALRRGFTPNNNVAWIFVVTMNLAKDQRRKRRRRNPQQALEDTNPMELSADQPSPSAGLEQSEMLAAARRAIHQLGEKEREVFLLRASAELSFEAVGQALGIPVGTAKTRMRSALSRLRGKLAEFDPQAAKHRQQHPMTGRTGS